MKKAPNSPRFIISTVAVALFGLMVGAPAWGQSKLLGTYEVMAKESHNPNHSLATYIVFKSTNASRSYGLLFMEIQAGGDQYQPFICDDAVWSKEYATFSCSRNFRKNDKDKRERLTVGRIDGKFCNTLRDTHERNGRPQVVVDQCPQDSKKCTCYEITHEDLDGDKSGPDGPPGGGAGSGKGN